MAAAESASRAQAASELNEELSTQRQCALEDCARHSERALELEARVQQLQDEAAAREAQHKELVSRIEARARAAEQRADESAHEVTELEAQLHDEQQDAAAAAQRAADLTTRLHADQRSDPAPSKLRDLAALEGQVALLNSLLKEQFATALGERERAVVAEERVRAVERDQLVTLRVRQPLQDLPADDPSHPAKRARDTASHHNGGEEEHIVVAPLRIGAMGRGGHADPLADTPTDSTCSTARTGGSDVSCGCGDGCSEHVRGAFGGEFRRSLERLLSLGVTGCSVQRDGEGNCSVNLSVSDELDGAEKNLLRRKVAGGVKERMKLGSQQRVSLIIVTPSVVAQQQSGSDFSGQYF